MGLFETSTAHSRAVPSSLQVRIRLSSLLNTAPLTASSCLKVWMGLFCRPYRPQPRRPIFAPSQNPALVAVKHRAIDLDLRV